MDSLTNNFLIAMPSLADPNFFRTVTLICQHNEDGAIGIVINRVTDITVKDIFEEMQIDAHDPGVLDVPVYSGGPVQSERGFVLHATTDTVSEALPVSETLSLSASREILEAVAEARGPNHYLIALGYAGWASGQLEQEISDNAWINGPASDDIIFSTSVEDRWSEAAAHLGVDLSRISDQAGHA